jgi:hypothetical protein
MYIHVKEDESDRAGNMYGTGVLLGRPKGNTSLRRPRFRWKYNFEMGFR